MDWFAGPLSLVVNLILLFGSTLVSPKPRYLKSVKTWVGFAGFVIAIGLFHRVNLAIPLVWCLRSASAFGCTSASQGGLRGWGPALL